MAFEDWLNEYIDWFGEIYPRRQCIIRFVRKGLIPFLEENGYKIDCSTECLQNYIANGFFDNSGLSHLNAEWKYPSANIYWGSEDRWHFDFILDSVAWERFWKVWGNWGDVSLFYFRGQDRRMDIQEFIWTQLSLENSKQSAVLYEIMLGGEDPDKDIASPRKYVYDTYLQESVEYNGWGGYRK